MLEREEYIEQAYLFRILGERMLTNSPIQEMLASVRDELLTTTRLPMAVDFMLGELRHCGVMGTAMAQLQHYFAPFQTYVIQEAEADRGRFDMRIALQILEQEARYRSDGGNPQGLFLYQLEAVCRNRLRYDGSLKAMSDDPVYSDDWQEWILTVRRQIGIIDLADMIFVRSAHYQSRRAARGLAPEKPVLFGEKEGRIALANRRKDPLYLFASLQRHLGYPGVPRPAPVDETPQLVPLLARRLERLEVRLKMLEEEQRMGSVDLSRFMERPRDGGGL